MRFREIPQESKKATLSGQMGQRVCPPPEHHFSVARSNALARKRKHIFFAPGSEEFLKIGGFVLHCELPLKALAKHAA
jgi:hypothetical protein